jgi:glycosyltransferase involved in cell wall biosynthesis
MSGICYLGPFNPLLSDGVSRSILEFCVFLKSLNCNATILGLLWKNTRIQQRMGEIKKQPDVEIVSWRHNAWDYVFKGVNIHFEMLNCNQPEYERSHRDVLRAMVKQLERIGKRRVITCDQNITGLTACSILDVEGIHYFHSPSCIGSFKAHPLHAAMLKKKTIFSVSRCTKDSLEKKLGISSILVPPFIDLHPASSPRSLKKHPVIGYYSAGPHKGDVIFNKLIAMYPDFRFIVMGSNYFHNSAEVPHNLDILGDVKDPQDFYECIDILLVPSILEEGFPRVILEAAAHGVPAIANAVGGIPEAMGDSGVLIPLGSEHPIDINGLADRYASAIRGLFDDEALYRLLQQKALERANAYRYQQKENTRTVYETYIKG